MRIAFLLSLSLLCVGCTRTPSELSNLVPVTITVTDGGKPVSGVLVSLALDRQGPVWASKGTTDAQGTAKIESILRSHSAPGAPADTYKVVVLQTVALPDELKMTQAEEDGTPASPEIRRQREAYIAQRLVVPETLRERATSPIDLTVEPGKPARLAVDLAEYR